MIKLINDDILKVDFSSLPPINLVITSPVYNVGISYDEHKDTLIYKDYLEWCKQWITEVFNVMADDGRVCINIPFSVTPVHLNEKKGEDDINYPVVADYTSICTKIGLKYWRTIVWDKNLSNKTCWGSWRSASSPFMRDPSEAILVFYKNVWKRKNEGTSTISGNDFMSWCYDDKTEVLTKNGWKLFKKIFYDDEIATLNQDKMFLEYQRPSEIVSYNYNGKMYKLQSKNVNLLVTPNHRMFVSVGQHNKHFEIVSAENCFHKFIRFKKNCNWKGEYRKTFELPAVTKSHYVSNTRTDIIKTDKKIVNIVEWLKFFGFWIAEGHVVYNESKYKYQVGVTNNNIDILKEMKSILFNFGFDSSIYKNQLICCNKQLSFYLSQFGKCHKKFIPNNIKELGSSFLQTLIYYYAIGDGHMENGKIKYISTTSKKLADDIQEILLKIGISGTISTTRKKGTSRFFKREQRNIIAKHNQYSIYFNYTQNEPRHYYKHPSNKKKSEQWVKYNKKIYCVSVPNEIIYVRRNGKSVWCGNTKNVWKMHPETRSEHPAAFPIELPDRCIKLFSYKEDTIMDCFLGSGTSGEAAIRLGRSFIGIEKSTDYFNMAKERIDTAELQTSITQILTPNIPVDVEDDAKEIW